MKNIKYKSIVFILIANLLIVFFASAQEDFVKKLHKDFDINENSMLEIRNKFGNVNIKNWDKNSVSVDVTIKVDAKNKEKADKILQQISIEFSNQENTDIVKAITKIDGSFNNVDFRIDYEVNMPKHLKLILENKYGSIFINELTGYNEITVKYGFIKANRLLNGKTKPKSQLNLAYSKGEINECNWLKLGVSYSQLSIKESKALMIVSKYSKFNIEKSSSLVIDSKYDTPYNIGEVNNFICTGKYSKYNIKKLNSRLELEIRYSNVSIDNTSNSFENIVIDSKYGSVKLNMDEASSYNLQAEAKYGDIDYPSNKTINKVQDGSELKIWGTIGNKETKAKVLIITEYGDVDLD